MDLGAGRGSACQFGRNARIIAATSFEVLVLGADLQDRLENCIQLADARGLRGLLDEDSCKCGYPLEEPVVMTLAQERFKEVRQAFKVLLIVVVVGDVADDCVALLSSSLVGIALKLLLLEYVTAVLAESL